MLFRWSVWGDINSHKEMLGYSIRSFKYYFGDGHDYVVATDQPHRLADLDGVTILPFDYDNMFCVDSPATWKKWSPLARLDIAQDEVYVDSDVFIVSDPIEIQNFLQNDHFHFAILDEHDPQPWQHGAMRTASSKDTPFVNAGFFIQRSGYSIQKELEQQYEWWNSNIPVNERQKHDEQGALALALTDYYNQGKVYVFSQDRFKLIGVPEVNSVHTLEGLELIHATYPNHPAFYKFKNNLPTI